MKRASPTFSPCRIFPPALRPKRAGRAFAAAIPPIVLRAALDLGMAWQFELHTPLMWLDKAATWKLAHGLGGAGLVDLIREHSHTCYLGERGARHDWGYGCGECPACALRAKGWREYGAG